MHVNFLYLIFLRGDEVLRVEIRFEMLAQCESNISSLDKRRGCLKIIQTFITGTAKYGIITK